MILGERADQMNESILPTGTLMGLHGCDCGGELLVHSTNENVYRNYNADNHKVPLLLYAFPYGLNKRCGEKFLVKYEESYINTFKWLSSSL